MTPTQLALRRAEVLLLERLEQVESCLSGGDAATLSVYCSILVALAMIVPQTTAEATGRLLTTREMAAALGVSPRTVLRKRKAGQLEAVQLGERGRAALRWKAR